MATIRRRPIKEVQEEYLDEFADSRVLTLRDWRLAGASKCRSAAFTIRRTACLCCLRYSATSRGHASSSSTWNETAATSILGESASTSLAWGSPFHSTSTPTHAPTVVEPATIGISTWATLFDINLLTADGVGIGSYSSVVTSGVSKLDKSAVLDIMLVVSLIMIYDDNIPLDG